jgi:hypothetical protein
MSQHGYAREYDEGWDRDEDRDWRDREWRGTERNRSFMIGDRDLEMGERGMSHYGREHGYGGFHGDYSRSGREQGGFGGRGDWEHGRRSFSANPDDHYRSWRDKQMQALDRDYEQYCREREQQFHRDFDSWRSNRRSRSQSGEPDELILDAECQAGSNQSTTADLHAESAASLDEGSATTTGRTRR